MHRRRVTLVSGDLLGAALGDLGDGRPAEGRSAGRVHDPLRLVDRFRQCAKTPKLGGLPIFGAARYAVLGDLNKAERHDLLESWIDRISMQYLTKSS